MGDIHLCNMVYFVQFANSVNSYNLRAVQLHVQLIFCKNKKTRLNLLETVATRLHSPRWHQ